MIFKGHMFEILMKDNGVVRDDMTCLYLKTILHLMKLDIYLALMINILTIMALTKVGRIILWQMA